MNSNKYSDIGLLALRIVFGMSMSLGHGLAKMPPSERWITGIGEMGFPLPSLFGWLAALSEFLGGILIATGIFTRPAAFMWIFTMGTAAFIRHADDPFSNKEKALLYLGVGICLLLTGGGKYSLGRILFKNNQSLLH